MPDASPERLAARRNSRRVVSALSELSPFIPNASAASILQAASRGGSRAEPPAEPAAEPAAAVPAAVTAAATVPTLAATGVGGRARRLSQRSGRLKERHERLLKHNERIERRSSVASRDNACAADDVHRGGLADATGEGGAHPSEEDSY